MRSRTDPIEAGDIANQTGSPTECGPGICGRTIIRAWRRLLQAGAGAGVGIMVMASQGQISRR
jgi:hypothetical protein